MLYYNKDDINNSVIIIKFFCSKKKKLNLVYKLPILERHLQDNGEIIKCYDNYNRFILLYAYN